MLINSTPPNAELPNSADTSHTIFDVTTVDFEQKVMAASMQTPVIVDFWAPWCGPCKQLMPVLEKLVGEANGAVLLAKVNLDDNPELAQALRVQSVPAVFAFFQGQPIDAFMGVQPESKIREFITKLITAANGAQPDALDIPEALKGAALALSENDAQTAHAIYSQILQQDALNAEAYAGMIRCFVSIGQIEQAEAMIEQAPEPISKTSAFTQSKSALELAKLPPQGDTEALHAKIQTNPNDHQAYIDLAMAHYTARDFEAAIDTLLKSIVIDRSWNEDAARKEMLFLFEAIGNKDPVVVAGRRKLSSILFS